MSDQRILVELQPVFDEVFASPVTLTADTTAEDIEQWDSLSHFELIVAIEQRFGVKITSQETRELGTVAAICSLLERKLGPDVA